jgi:hypothetical protein
VQVFWIKPSSQFRRADKIAEQHGHLPPLGFRYRWYAPRLDGRPFRAGYRQG